VGTDTREPDGPAGVRRLFDKERLIEEIRAGNANPVDTFHPRWGPYYSDETVETFETSVETEAGHPAACLRHYDDVSASAE
jgi:hypothetical protein